MSGPLVPVPEFSVSRFLRDMACGKTNIDLADGTVLVLHSVPPALLATFQEAYMIYSAVIEDAMESRAMCEALQARIDDAKSGKVHRN
jgi:hypothetical protein